MELHLRGMVLLTVPERRRSPRVGQATQIRPHSYHRRGGKSLETGWLFIEKLDAQLHVALVSLCRDEALTVVKNSGKRQSVDTRFTEKRKKLRLYILLRLQGLWLWYRGGSSG